MSKPSQYAHRIACVTLIIVCTMVGWFIPHFYKWTDSDQSRPSPLLWALPLAVGLAGCVFSCVLPWLPISSPEPVNESQGTKRFGLRALLVLTTIVAVAIPLLAKFPVATSSVICALAFLNFVRIAVKYPGSRLPAVTLLACMILPFAWIIGYEERHQILTTVIMMAAALPTILVAAVVGLAFDVNPQDSYWIAVLFTGVELTVGIWLIQLGARRAFAFSMLVMLISMFSSLGFYQLCRA